MLADQRSPTIPFVSIANIYLGFATPGTDDGCDGCAGSASSSIGANASPMLGAIYCSSIFPQSAQDGKFLVRVMVGGALHAEAVERDEEDLAREAEATLRRYTGLDSQLLFQRVYKVRDAIPQYSLGHAQRLANIRAAEARIDGLRLLGNSYDAVSIVGQLAEGV